MPNLVVRLSAVCTWATAATAAQNYVGVGQTRDMLGRTGLDS